MRTRRAFLTQALASVGAAFCGSGLGCVGGTKCFLRRKEEAVSVNPLARTETAFRVCGRVKRMEVAQNSKRILVELRDFDETPEDAYADFFAAGGVRNAVETTNGGALELWNVEFLEARREAFDATEANVVESAVFDDGGTRVFWT
ncbi:MAG: hypothetical protein IKY61_04575, partial [Thermoguttaceae bacterium]|nr:hypothetical protein [Thermoguttaceae bacterium]